MQTVHVPDRIPLDTTPSECHFMKQHRWCGNHRLELRNGKWIYDALPEPDVQWLRTKTSTGLNFSLLLTLVHTSIPHSKKLRPSMRPPGLSKLKSMALLF